MVEFSILDHGFQRHWNIVYWRSWAKLPNLHFSSSSRPWFCNYKKENKICIFIFNLFFRNLNVLSKAKPILKTLQVCLLYSKKEYRAAKTRVILVVRLNEVPQFCRIFATVFSMSIIAFRLCFIVLKCKYLTYII